MKTLCRCSTIAHDEVRFNTLRDPQRAEFALRLALKEFKKDRDMNSLLDTLEQVLQAQRSLGNPASARL